MTLGTIGLLTMGAFGIVTVGVAMSENTRIGMIILGAIVGGGLWYLFKTLSDVLSNTFFL